MAALVGAFLVLDRQTAGLVEVIMFWAMPLPLLIYSAKYGFKNGMMVTISIFLLSLMIALPDKIIMTLGSCLIGLIYGSGVKKGWGVEKLLLATFVGMLVYYYCTMFFFASFFGYDIIGESRLIVEGITQIPLLGGVSTDRMNDFVMMMTIAIPLFMSVLQTILTHLLSILLLKRFRIATIKTPNLFAVKLPRILGWILTIVYILVTLVLMFEKQLQLSSVLYSILLGLQFISMGVLLFFGIICIMVIGLSNGKKSITLICVILAFLLPQIFVFVGMLDSVTDIRIDLSRRS